MLRCMRTLDAPGARKLWAEVRPGMPQPKTDAEALKMLHLARVQSDAIGAVQRAYSHRWLLDHGLESPLPDHMKPKAERMYPAIVEAVGISVNGKGIFKPIVTQVRGAMEAAVLECFADGDRATEIVRPRMMEAKDRTVKQLLGI